MFLLLARHCVIGSTYSSEPNRQRDSTLMASVIEGKSKAESGGYRHLLTLLIGSRKACHSLG
jgi:hypothetical protein